jgi:hypothetical protein
MITQSTIFSIIIFDYQIVIIKHNHKISYEHNKMTLLQNGSSEQASPISDGVMEIQINITLQGNNLTT